MEKVRETYDRELDAKHAAARGLVDAIVTPENLRESLILALQTCLNTSHRISVRLSCQTPRLNRPFCPLNTRFFVPNTRFLGINRPVFEGFFGLTGFRRSGQ
jgi:hypothetical protein